MDYGLAAIITTGMICITPILLKFIPNKKTTTVENITTSVNKELFEEKFKNLREQIQDLCDTVERHVISDEKFFDTFWKELNQIKNMLLRGKSYPRDE